MLEEQTKEDVKMAEDAINNLVPENIEKRSHVSPDKSLLESLKAVMILLQKPLDWESISKEMRTPNLFIRQLQSIDKRNIPEKVITELDKFTNEINPDLEDIRSNSLTAYYLWIWVHSIENYHEICCKIRPMNEKLKRT